MRAPSWHLVSINPKTGQIKKKFDIAPAGNDQDWKLVIELVIMGYNTR